MKKTLVSRYENPDVHNTVMYIVKEESEHRIDYKLVVPIKGWWSAGASADWNIEAILKKDLLFRTAVLEKSNLDLDPEEIIYTRTEMPANWLTNKRNGNKCKQRSFIEIRITDKYMNEESWYTAPYEGYANDVCTSLARYFLRA